MNWTYFNKLDIQEQEQFIKRATEFVRNCKIYGTLVMRRKKRSKLTKSELERYNKLEQYFQDKIIKE